MPKLHVLQSNFVTGQLDPAAQSRSETALYRNGAAALRNCDPFVAGGVRSRRGSWHCGTLHGPAVIREFSFSLEQSYVAAFTNGRVDFYFSSDGAYCSGIAACPWSGDILRELRFAQLGDVMWVVHPSFFPQEIVRTSATAFLLRDMVFDGVRGTPTYRYAEGYVSAQAGGSVASSILLGSLPLVGGQGTALWVGMAGQARATAGPGPWKAFHVVSVAGLLLGITWDADGLSTGTPMDVQLEGAPQFGGGGGTSGGLAGDGGGGGSGGAAGGDAAGPGESGGPGDAGPGDAGDPGGAAAPGGSAGDPGGSGDGGDGGSGE